MHFTTVAAPHMIVEEQQPQKSTFYRTANERP